MDFNGAVLYKAHSLRGTALKLLSDVFVWFRYPFLMANAPLVDVLIVSPLVSLMIDQVRCFCCHPQYEI